METGTRDSRVGLLRGLLQSESFFVSIAYALLYLGQTAWQGLVNKHVPEPYLDEVFHVPQAQSYCDGSFTWDPKITTPPGLYLISLDVSKILSEWFCTTQGLRAINGIGLIVMLSAAHACRKALSSTCLYMHTRTQAAVCLYDIHTAMNISLFPPLFFFSALYYTDVWSSAFVVLAHGTFLRRKPGIMSPLGGISTIAIGLLALSMRQTNIFWISIFMAGMEWARARPVIRMRSKDVKGRSQLLPWLKDLLAASAKGEIYSCSLHDACFSDYVSCVLSLGISAICNPSLLLMLIWPYVFLLATFGAFVVWNGGVVLGDKSNHVATIHLPQMLYLWPFMTFFSFPLLLPHIIRLISAVFSLLGLPPSPLVPASFRQIFETKKLTWLSIALFVAFTMTAVGVAHFNTLIHPFTLADNRHYVFYAFRYTIRQYNWVKYALAPVYVMCCIFVLETLAQRTNSTEHSNVTSGTGSSASTATKSVSQRRPLDEPLSKGIDHSMLFVVVWILSSALSLVTAPLVEPRYFIVPWLMWRMNVPPSPLMSWSKKVSQTSQHSALEAEMKADYRLVLETAWFILVNVVTGYVFLFQGFIWPSEPGKTQRFMW